MRRAIALGGELESLVGELHAREERRRELLTMIAAGDTARSYDRKTIDLSRIARQQLTPAHKLFVEAPGEQSLTAMRHAWKRRRFLPPHSAMEIEVGEEPWRERPYPAR